MILASASKARQEMLRNAGLTFEVHPADIEEKSLIEQQTEQSKSIKEITLELAKQKALHIAKQHPNQIVIGADQTLGFEGKILSKAITPQDALTQLKQLSGKTHTLYSAVTIAKNEQILWFHVNPAHLTMHPYKETFLQFYAKKDPEALTTCVGGYRIEGPGAWLFEKIEGDIFTIMGLPLLPLLNYLREQ